MADLPTRHFAPYRLSRQDRRGARAINHCVDACTRRSNIRRGKIRRIALHVNFLSCWRIEHGKTEESRHRLGKRSHHSRQESSRVASRWSRKSHSVRLVREPRKVCLDGSAREADEQRTARLDGDESSRDFHDLDVVDQVAVGSIVTILPGSGATRLDGLQGPLCLR
jgi:hypothetical protein